MTISGVIFDVSGTMLDASRTRPIPGIIDAIERLRSIGVQIVAAENDGPRSTVVAQLQRAGIPFDHVVTRREVAGNKAKGSPLWIDRICQDTRLAKNQLIYIGDSDGDMITASKARVVYFHARWSKPNHVYGLPAYSPSYVADIVANIFRKQHLWTWNISQKTDEGTHIRQMALIDGNGAGDLQLKGDLIALLKGHGDSNVGKIKLGEFVVLHLVASLYASGIPSDVDFWGVCPSRDGSRIHPLSVALDTTAKMFRDQYRPDLLIRRGSALNSNAAYKQLGLHGAIDNQLQSVFVNEQYRDKLKDKTIILLDDFLTHGPTTGVARCLLRAAGAKEVIVVGVGKYGPGIHLIEPPASFLTWNTSQRPPFTGSDCSTSRVTATFNESALNEFAASHRAMQAAQW